MSLVTHGKFRTYERRFDWDEARRRYAAGESIRELAAIFGVTQQAMRRACDENYRLKAVARARAHSMTGTCSDCGEPCARYTSAGRCQRCAAIVATTTVREGELFCNGCDEWKPDADFPNNRTEIRRRSRHTMCRRCASKLRREYRESRRVPCEGGCGRLVEGAGRANTRAQKDGKRIRLDPNRPYLCHSCATKRPASEASAHVRRSLPDCADQTRRGHRNRRRTR